MSRHIFHNEFYSSMPLPNWSYEVFFHIPIKSGINNESVANDLSNAVQSVKIPQRQLNVVTTSFRGLQFNLPARYENTGVLEIRFAENVNLTTYKNIICKLFTRSFNTINYFRSNDGFNNYVDAKGKIVNSPDDPENPAVNTYWCVDKPFQCHIGIKNPATNKLVQVFSFYDCYIETVSEVSLDYSKTDDVYEYTCSIHYNRVSTDADEYNTETNADILERRKREKAEEQAKEEAAKQEEAEKKAAEEAAKKEQSDKRKALWNKKGGAFEAVGVGSLKNGETKYYKQADANGFADDVMSVSMSKDGKTATIKGTTTDELGNITMYEKTIERGDMSKNDFKDAIRDAASEVYSDDTGVQFKAVSGKKGKQQTKNFDDAYDLKKEIYENSIDDTEETNQARAAANDALAGIGVSPLSNPEMPKIQRQDRDLYDDSKKAKEVNSNLKKDILDDDLGFIDDPYAPIPLPPTEPENESEEPTPAPTIPKQSEEPVAETKPEPAPAPVLTGVDADIANAKGSAKSMTYEEYDTFNANSNTVVNGKKWSDMSEAEKKEFYDFEKDM